MNPSEMTPRQWLMCDVARCYGLDKATWSERWKWATDHPAVMAGAKEPFLYKSALEASQSVETDHLISLDATASGIQCLALMAQDMQSALAVNLGPTNEVRNPYRAVHEAMGSAYPYEKVKKSLMTACYESVATPLELFGTDYDRFLQASRDMLPGVMNMVEAISSCMVYKEFYSWTMMDGFEVNMEITNPVECSMDIGDGQKITWMEHRRAPVGTKGLTANVTHSIDSLIMREVVRRTHCTYKWNDNMFTELREKDIKLMEAVLRWQISKFVSVQFLEYMDEENGALVPQALRDEVDMLTLSEEMYMLTIHDCWLVKAIDASLLFDIVKEVYASLAYAKTAQWILPQLDYKGSINDNEGKRSQMKAAVMESLYLIC